MQFEYFKRTVAEGVLDLDDIGNCCLMANADTGETFVLIIRTVCGMTEIFQYGPDFPDMSKLPDNLVLSYWKGEFNEKSIKKTISGFLNQRFVTISQAQEIPVEEAKSLIKNIAEYI